MKSQNMKSFLCGIENDINKQGYEPLLYNRVSSQTCTTVYG